MTNELFIAIENGRSAWSKQALNLAKSLPGIKTQQWTENSVGKVEPSAKTKPDIIIIDDDPDRGSLFARVRGIKLSFPQAALFVVSSNKDPQQIINAMKAGVAEYLVEPVSDTALQNAIEDVRARLANKGKLAQGSIYSFISSKGGIGATALAVNTAAALAMEKKRAVALLDLSLQSGDASVLLDIMPQTTILDISRNIQRLDLPFLRGTMTSHSTGLNFLAAPPDPEDVSDIKAEHVGRILDLSRRIFDQVIIDCSSMHITNCTVEAFKNSDKVFIITDMSVPSIRNTVRLYKLIRKLGIGMEHIEIIINRYIKGGPLPLSAIEKNFEKPVYWLAPNDFADIVTSINRGTPLVKLKPGALFSKNIVQLAGKILNPQENSDFRGIRGALGRNL